MRALVEIEAELSALEIPFHEVEFYNHPRFLAAERDKPTLLETYCEYVSQQDYSEEYIARSRRVVPLVTGFLHEELKRDGKQGACLDFVQAAMKILERVGIWCCAMAGSMTIEFAPKTKQPPRYWAHFFEPPKGANAAGHAWLMAPPFHIIDMTVGLQPNTSDVRRYLPDFIVTESVGQIEGVAIEDMVDDDLMLKSRLAGYPVPTIHQLMKENPVIAGMLNKFRPFSVTHQQATLKYFPCQTGALIEKFEDVTTHCFSGQTVPELFRSMSGKLGDQIA